MRINELKGLPNKDYFNNLEYNNPWESDEESFISGKKTLRAAMKSHGFTRLGEGNYASVFGRNDYPWILKVFSLSDRAYLAWIQFSKANPDNPFVPQFKGNVVRFNNAVGVIRVEKLKPITSKTKNYNNLEALMWSFPEKKDWEAFEGHRDHIMAIREFMKSYSNDVDVPNVMKRDNGQLVLIDPVA